MPKRYQSTLIIGEMLSGKSYWVSTHLEELRTEWFGVDQTAVWDGLQSKTIGDLAMLNGNDLLIFDHVITDDQWQELFKVLPLLAERGVATMIIAQPDVGNPVRMAKMFNLTDQWLFFRHDKTASKIYKDETLQKVCALQKSFIDSLPGLAVGEYRFVQSGHKTQHSRR